MLCLQYLLLLEHSVGHLDGENSVDEVVSVSDAKQLVDHFQAPANTDAGAEDFYSAESFLRYGSSLKVVRVASATAYNANDGGDTDASIKNLEDYNGNYEDGGNVEQ